MNQTQAQNRAGFVKRAAQYGISPIEAGVAFQKIAMGGGMGGPPPGMGGGPPGGGDEMGGGHPGGHPGGGPQVTVDGQPLPPELAHIVVQILHKLTQGGGGGAGGPGGPGGPQMG